MNGKMYTEKISSGNWMILNIVLKENKMKTFGEIADGCFVNTQGVNGNVRSKILDALVDLQMVHQKHREQLEDKIAGLQDENAELVDTVTDLVKTSTQVDADNTVYELSELIRLMVTHGKWDMFSQKPDYKKMDELYKKHFG